MGFAGRIIRLRWPDGHPLHGMEVDLRPPSNRAATMLQEGPDKDAGETREQFGIRKLETLAQHVIRWNLEAADQPLPHTGEALHGFQDVGAVVEILEAWEDSVRVPAPSKAEDPVTGRDREPIDPLGETSVDGSGTASNSAVEVLIPTQAM